MRYLTVTLLSLLTLTSAAPAQRAPAAGAPAAGACDIKAYQGNRVSDGVNVRAAPSTQARVVRNLRPEGTSVFDITGYNAGWFRISGAVEAESDSRIFAGDGWVHHSQLGLRAAHYNPRLFAGPNAQSRVLANLGGQEPEVALLGCTGDWAQVRAGNRIGWLAPDGQCSNPLTTCS